MQSFERLIPPAPLLLCAVVVNDGVVVGDVEVSEVVLWLRKRVIICVSSLLSSSAPRPSNCCDALGAL